MDIKRIQELIRFVQESGVSEVVIEQKDFKITIKTHHPSPIVHAKTFPDTASPTILEQADTSTQVKHTETTTDSAIPASAEIGQHIKIKSPMIGTFYRSKSPGKPPFVHIGDVINPGTVLCVIEAMKLFNEIESEVCGRIVKVLVEDASPVAYDQELFLVEPIHPTEPTSS